MWQNFQDQDTVTYSPAPAPQSEEKLDRALVAGLILEVMLESPEDWSSPHKDAQGIKNRLKDYLVEHLAGRVTLDRFRLLASRLDNWFEFYYPLLTPDARRGGVTYTAGEPAAPYSVREPAAGWRAAMPLPQPSCPVRPVFWEDLLDRWLAELDGQLPHRSHRKISPRKLKEFLQGTSGGWFRLRDFERYFKVDRKTAWDYLQQFLQAGLVCHNRRQSAAVRYCATPHLLKVEADALRLALSLVLPDFSEEEVERLGDLLIASAGEPFHEKEWREHFRAGQLDHLISILSSSNILSLQVVPSGARLIRLRGRWLQSRPSFYRN